MKNVSLFILISLFSLNILAQEKELLLTLKEGEYFNSDNSKIIPTSSGIDWEIVVEDDYRKYFKYTKTIKGEPIGVITRPGAFISMGKEDGLDFFVDNSNGKKYGPYKELKPRYNEEKKVLYGYSYLVDGKNYFVDLRNDKKYGPFDKGGLWYIDEENLVYSYNEGDDLYLMENGTKHGAYQQVSYHVPAKANIKPLIIYKKDNKFYAAVDHCKGVIFGRHPNVSELESGWVIEGSEEITEKVKWLYLPDGQKLESSDKIKHIVNFKGDVLKGILEAGGGSCAAFKVSYNGKDIGTYALKKSYREDIMNTDFFNIQLMGVTINSPSSSFAKQDENYYYSPSKGLIGPLNKKEAGYVYFYSGGYAYLTADSTLIVNGKKTLEHIAFATFRDGPDWYAFQKRGDYLYPFMNGKEIAVEELPEKYTYFDTEEKQAVRVKRGDEFYVRIKGKDELQGPIGQFDAFIVSPDGNHLAYEKGVNGYVVVDGKQIAKGYSIVFNELLNAFHWWNIEGQKVYLYTYKL